MIKTLRKRHLQVWTIISVLMPLAIICAVIVVPSNVTNKSLKPAGAAALPLVLKTINKYGYTVNLRASADTALLQLEWTNKNILTHPTALVYQVPSFETDIDSGGESTLVIGRIASQGTYLFPLGKYVEGKAQYFVIYDIIHHQKIDSLTF